MTHKILKVGTSAAVTIPKDYLRELGLRVGDRVDVHYEERESAIHLRPVRRRKVVVARKSQEYLEEFFGQYHSDLARLAKL